ncbi:MAG TPA: PLP-dependent aminotransferase family protein, partial [Vicinamibacterales bacterium]
WRQGSTCQYDGPETVPQKDQSINGFFSSLGVAPGDIPRERPMYRQLVGLVERGLSSGVLRQGARLPPERDLARACRVSRTTVVTAYRELEAKGLVRGYVGRGTFVSAVLEPEAAPFAWRGKVSTSALQMSDSTVRHLVRVAWDPAVVSFAAGQPALDRFPTGDFCAAVDRVLTRDAAVAWHNGPTEGLASCRDAIASRFGGAGDQILVVSGAQQGLDLLARCLLDPGDTAIVDRPTYLGAMHSFRGAGARLVGWDIRRADIDELEELMLRYRPKLVYLNPTFQNPTGQTLSIRARRDVLGLAERYRVPVVEDETSRELHLDEPPPASLFSLDERRTVVIHLNTFSKTLAPGLRVGWIAAARPIIEQLSLLKQRVDLHAQNLAQLVITEFLAAGTFDRHLVTLRDEHRRRRDAMVQTLRRHTSASQVRFATPTGGLYFWCHLSGQARARVVQELAEREGLAVMPGDPFYPDGGGTQELRVCFTTQTPDRIAAAGPTLGRAIADAYRRPEAAPRIPMS